MSLRARLVVAAVAGSLFLTGFAAIERALAPTGDTGAGHLDAIIVLGSDVDRDGNPSPVLLSRISEGVREYERGVASHLIMSGAPHRGFPQAAIMARAAEAQGIPPSAIVLEPAARDTIQNACFSERIMKMRGWRSAEVITSPSHLPRANLIFSHFPLQWRGHAAPPLSSAASSWYDVPLELLKTARYAMYARWTESCEP